MSGISKVETGIIVVSVLFLFALIANLFYVLGYQRRFRRRSSFGDSEFPDDPYASPSKELLYFFCWKNQSPVEPAGAPSFCFGQVLDGQLESSDKVKWQGLYGPSRVFFTIKETEDLESVKSSVERKAKKFDSDFTGEELEAPATVSLDEGTPFSTPCASPPYYTPSPSPPREEQWSVGHLTELPV